MDCVLTFCLGPVRTVISIQWARHTLWICQDCIYIVLPLRRFFLTLTVPQIEYYIDPDILNFKSLGILTPIGWPRMTWWPWCFSQLEWPWHVSSCDSVAEESVQLLWPLCTAMVLRHGLGPLAVLRMGLFWIWSLPGWRHPIWQMTKIPRNRAHPS